MRTEIGLANRRELTVLGGGNFQRKHSMLLLTYRSTSHYYKQKVAKLKSMFKNYVQKIIAKLLC